MSSIVSARPIVHRSCPISSDNRSNNLSAFLTLARTNPAVPADIHNVQPTGPPDLSRRLFPSDPDHLQTEAIWPPNICQPAVPTDIPEFQRTGPPDLSRRFFPSDPDHLQTAAILAPNIGSPKAPNLIETLGPPPDLSRPRFLDNGNPIPRAPMGHNMGFSHPDLSPGQCEATGHVSTDHAQPQAVSIASDHPKFHLVPAAAAAASQSSAPETAVCPGATDDPVQAPSAFTVRKYWRHPDYPRLVDEVPFPPPSVCGFSYIYK
jgi:hypothetical protein